MQTPDPRLTLMRRLAWTCVALLLAITTLSAFIRLSRAGVGCEPWPQCHAQRQLIPATQLAAADTPEVAHARIAHRILGGAAVLLMIVLLVQAWSRTPVYKEQGQLAAAMLLLGLFLAILGRTAGDPRVPAVVAANLLGGFSTLALAWRLALSCDGGHGRAPPTRKARHFLVAALMLLALQVALGGLLSASEGPGRCGESLLCSGHRLSGVATVVASALAGAAAWRPGGFAARAVLPLAAVQAALGLALLGSQVTLLLVLAHNVIAAVLAAVLFGLVSVPRR
ncbi:hypothetical protein GCM10027034_28710 [Ramlibacter solisilvae]|uniref:Cytochrome oxidase assembly protein n=1 Tax=Ramlibacter tataouinensis TaxID=94132 RepID=A0A127JR89_9BURK|nr:COX15/CtaA family protein [Ramlibacter tataouinensis]AMO22486.1 hypothetical protein UC35_05760 [Ramlibacter tataouinensis]